MALNQKKLLYRPSLKCPHLGGLLNQLFLFEAILTPEMAFLYFGLNCGLKEPETEWIWFTIQKFGWVTTFYMFLHHLRVYSPKFEGFCSIVTTLLLYRQNPYLMRYYFLANVSRKKNYQIFLRHFYVLPSSSILPYHSWKKWWGR